MRRFLMKELSLPSNKDWKGRINSEENSQKKYDSRLSLFFWLVTKIEMSSRRDVATVSVASFVTALTMIF